MLFITAFLPFYCISLQFLTGLVNEKRRRLELLHQLSEIDKRLEALQQQGPAQADTIVEIETTQIETTQSNKKASKQLNLFTAFKMT